MAEGPDQAPREGRFARPELAAEVDRHAGTDPRRETGAQREGGGLVSEVQGNRRRGRR